MFDDQNPHSAGTPPGNLPVGPLRGEASEPEDIFAVAEPAPPSGAPAPSALSAGALRPKAPPLPIAEVAPPPAVPSGYPLKAPKFSRYLMAVVLIILGIAVIGGGGWFLYASFVREEAPPRPAALPPPTPLLPAESVPGAVEDETGPTIPEQTTDEQALFGEPIDLDGDGLDGNREADIGTDPNNWDSDGDSLSDYDEVAVWKTDPLNPDSDADGYRDGDEVKSGYNPAGPGKIFEPPVQ